MPAEPTPTGAGAPAPALPQPAGAELELAATAAASDPGLAREYLELLDSAPGALFRDGGPRHLTASGIVVDGPGEHVALVWHLKGRFWVQPGGHLEEGETSFEQAARREVAEEIGLTGLERVGDGPAILNRHGLDSGFGRCQEHWDVQFLLRAPHPAARTPLRASEESGAVEWFPWPSRTLLPGTAQDLLPAGVVPDLPATLESLARLYTALHG